MDKELKTKIASPLIGKVILLDRALESIGKLPEKRLQHTKVKRIDEKMDLLYEYALRQLEGLDYIKRCQDLLKSIQAITFRLYGLHGIDYKSATHIDSLCDEFLEELTIVQNSQHHKS